MLKYGHTSKHVAPNVTHERWESSSTSVFACITYMLMHLFKTQWLFSDKYCFFGSIINIQFHRSLSLCLAQPRTSRKSKLDKLRMVIQHVVRVVDCWLRRFCVILCCCCFLLCTVEYFLDCNFDQGGCEWVQDKTDDMDWTVAYHSNGNKTRTLTLFFHAQIQIFMSI